MSLSSFEDNSTWSFSFLGPGINSNTSWGLSVSEILSTGYTRTYLAPLSIGALFAENETVPVYSSIQNISVNGTISARATFNQSNGEFLLGPRTTLSIDVNQAASNPNKSSTSTYKIPSIPFGLNLGKNGVWKGSVVLNGGYDANRLQPGSFWAAINQSEFGSVSLTQNGHFKSPSTTLIKFGTLFDGYIYNIDFDINSPSIIYPKGRGLCNQTIYFGVPSFPYLIIPANLTDSPSTCYESETLGKYEMIMGRPFFQAAYVYVPDDGDIIWLGQARQDDVPIFPAVFDAKSELGLPLPIPTQYLVPSTTESSLNKGAIIGGTIGGLLGLALIALVALYVLRRRKLGRVARSAERPAVDPFK